MGAIQPVSYRYQAGGMMSSQATPVNAPAASRFQVQRPYRRVPEQFR